MKYRLLPIVSASVLACAFVASLFQFEPVHAATQAAGGGLSATRINRATLSLGGTYFYDSDTTDNDWSFKAVNADCPATIRLIVNGYQSTWTYEHQTKNQSGSGCGPKTTQNISDPLYWQERQYIVFAGGSSDGKFISVLPKNDSTFKKGGAYNGDTVYIQQGIDPYECPLVIVTNSRSTALIPLEKKGNESSVSKQIRTLFSKELNVPDTACGPTDNDKLGIFKQFGLPESYYDAGSTKNHYETTDFGFDGDKIGSATIFTGTIAQVAGIAASGPLAGGGYSSTGGSSANPGDNTSSIEPTCEVDGFGWVICPLITMMQKATEAVSGFLDTYLQAPPLTGNTGSTIYKGWSNMVGIANILLVIAFLYLIFSQITSVGLSSYGVKRLLPRIVIAAILINISYYICAIMVDISNIVGANIGNLIYSSFSGVKDGGGITSGIAAVAGWVFAAGVAAAGLIVVAFFFMVPAVIAILSLFVVIAARSAIMTLLIIIAPLAFAAWVLPNTDKWFKKWWDLFLQMLIIYPAIMAIFAAASAAATIVAQGSTSANGPGSDIMALLIGLLIQALPLFALPALIKMSSGVLARIDGMTKNGIRKSRSAYADTDFGKYRKARRDMRAQQELMGNKQAGAWRSPTLLAARGKRALYGSRVSGGYGAYKTDAVQDQARESQEKLQQEFARVSPFAAQAFVNAKGDSAAFSNEISRRIAEGQLNENDVATLRRIERRGMLASGTAMAGAVGSLAASGFLEDDHIRNAEEAIHNQFGRGSDQSKIALDRLADTIDNGAKNSGMAQHMRWGTVGGELLQNGQDFDLDQARAHLSAQEQQQYDTLSAKAKDAGASVQERQDAAFKAAKLIVKGQKQVQTQLGFQKLASASAISRKAFGGNQIATDSQGKKVTEGIRAFRQAMHENTGFQDDALLTAAGVRGQMSAQDRQVLLGQVRDYFEETQPGIDFNSLVNEAKGRAGLQITAPPGGVGGSSSTPNQP